MENGGYKYLVQMCVAINPWKTNVSKAMVAACDFSNSKSTPSTVVQLIRVGSHVRDAGIQ